MEREYDGQNNICLERYFDETGAKMDEATENEVRDSISAYKETVSCRV